MVHIGAPCPSGTFFGFMSTALVCVVSILTNTMQKTHEVSSFQMLLNVAPMEARGGGKGGLVLSSSNHARVLATSSNHVRVYVTSSNNRVCFIRSSKR